MGYERYPRGNDRGGDYYNRSQDQDYGRDYGSGRDYSYSSARDYGAAGQYGDRDSYGARDSYAPRDDDREDWGRGNYGRQTQGYGRDRDYGRSQGYGGQGYGPQGYRSRGGYGRDDDRYTSPYRGSYMSDGRRTLDQDRGAYQRGRGFSGQPQGYDYDDRGFFDRAGDEVRSWFGDDDAERRRDMDRRYDERYARDDHYGNWRQQRINELDRDYDEYRRENATKFENEFSNFRTERQTQRDSLNKVDEHMEVIGSDGQHVGTVDKVRGERIILTKSDSDAGGRHHSIPSRWIESVDDKVTLRKSSDEAKSEWRDEERNQAMFRENEGRGAVDTATGTRNLNRSFSGTY